jgi:hypothetical protein
MVNSKMSIKISTFTIRFQAFVERARDEVGCAGGHFFVLRKKKPLGKYIVYQAF